MFGNRFEGKYWDSLGEYTYMFMPEGYDFDGETPPGFILYEMTKEYGHVGEYHGKAVDDRASHHVDGKDYDLNRCYLTSINLEKFKRDRRAQDESARFALWGKGKDNVNYGNHMECFPYVKLVDHYAEWKQGQRDVKFEAVDFINNYELGTKWNNGGTSVNAHVTSETVKHRRGNIKIFWRNDNPKITVVRLGYAQDHDNFMKEVSLEYKGVKINEWRGEKGGAQPTGFCFEVDDQDTAFKYWDEFHN